MENASPKDSDFWQMDFSVLAEMVLQSEQLSMRPKMMRVLADRAKADLEHLSVLAAALRDLDPSTRRRAAQTLGYCGEPARSLLPELCRLLRSDSIWTVREASARAIHTLSWPSESPESSEAVPLLLLECLLSDREPLVREACTQALAACLKDTNVVEPVKVAIWRGLKEGLQHAHASRRCRAISALCALADQNPAMIPCIAEGLQDSHWKVRRSTVQQLLNHSEIVFSVEGRQHLLAELVKRRFDQNPIVQAAAGQTLSALQAIASNDLRLILEQVGACSTAREALFNLARSGEVSTDVQRDFLSLCQRRLEWHLREMPNPRPGSTDEPADVETALALVLDLAGQWMASPKRLARAPQLARTQVQEKEASWLLARMIELLSLRSC